MICRLRLLLMSLSSFINRWWGWCHSGHAACILDWSRRSPTMRFQWPAAAGVLWLWGGQPATAISQHLWPDDVAATRSYRANWVEGHATSGNCRGTWLWQIVMSDYAVTLSGCISSVVTANIHCWYAEYDFLKVLNWDWWWNSGV